jgi:diguanylate cyclase (GGDEF)-like protein
MAHAYKHPYALYWNAFVRVGFFSVVVALAKDILSRIRARLLAAMGERGWPVTFSIGAVTFKPAEVSLERMIQRADELMYQAKSAGKNRIEHESFES